MFSLSHFKKSEAIKSGIIAFLFKCLGLVAAFGFNYIIAKHYGAAITGNYFLASNVIIVGYTISTYGYQNTVLKVVSANFILKNFRVVAKAINSSLITSFILSIIVIVLLFALGNVFENYLFHTPGLALRIKILAASVTFTTVALIGSEYLRGIDRLKRSFFVRDFATPIISFVTLFAFIAFHSFNELNIYYATLVGCGVVCILTLFFIYQSLADFKKLPTNNADFKFSETNGMSWNFFVISMMGTVARWNDLFFIGIFCGAADVGIYGIAKRSAYLISFFAYAVNNVVAPKFAQYKANHEMDKLKRLYKKSIIFLSIIVVPPLIVLIVFNKSILHLFGNEFVNGSTVFILMILGQLFNVVTGPCNSLLSMVGYDKLLRNATLIFTISAVVGTFFAVKYYGIVGAAVVNFLFMTISNLYNFAVIVRNIYIKNEYKYE